MAGAVKNGEDDTARSPTPTAPFKRTGLRRHDQLRPGISTIDEAPYLVFLLCPRSAPGVEDLTPEREESAIQKEEDLGQERVDAWLRTQ